MNLASQAPQRMQPLAEPTRTHRQRARNPDTGRFSHTHLFLTAGAALKLRDRHGWVPAALALVYPALHARIPPASASLAAVLAELPPLFHGPAEEGNPLSENYLGGPLSSADGYAFPANAVLDGLSPTLVLNAEYDHLRASGEAFTAAAALAGVDIRQVTIRGLLHGFLNLPAEVEPVRRCLNLIAGTVARAACDPWAGHVEENKAKVQPEA